MVALVVIWVATRALVGWVTVEGEIGPYRDRAPAGQDIVLYDFWAARLAEGLRPYDEFGLEYPPANIPVVAAPRTLGAMGGWGYRSTFVALSVGVDALVLVGLLRLARKGSLVGATTWVLGIPALGPVAFSRLDLIPAAGLVWAVVLAVEGRWGRSGAALGVAIGTKVFAGLLLPIVAIMSPRRRATLVGVGVVIVLPFLPFLDLFDALYRNLWTYHSRRELEVGSIWSSVLLLREQVAGRVPTVELRSGGWEVLTSLSSTFKVLATIAVLAVTAETTRLAAKRRDGGVAPMAVLMAATVTLTVGLGNVLSPQYLVWCVGAVAAAAAIMPSLRGAAALIVVVCAMTQLVFPVFFWDIVFFQHVPATLLLLARNVLLLTVGVLLVRAVDRIPAGQIEQDAAQIQLSNSSS